MDYKPYIVTLTEDGRKNLKDVMNHLLRMGDDVVIVTVLSLTGIITLKAKDPEALKKIPGVKAVEEDRGVRTI